MVRTVTILLFLRKYCNRRYRVYNYPMLNLTSKGDSEMTNAAVKIPHDSPFYTMPMAIASGRALTREDSLIIHNLQYRNSRGDLAGCIAQAVRIMDQGRVLEPFK